MIVDVADGHHRELVHYEGGESRCAVFSPDGHSIAYSVMSGAGSSIAMHIFTMPTEGAKPQEVYWGCPLG
jgi:Tol biopolymer transport system component